MDMRGQRDSSRDALDELRASKKLGAQEQKIMDFLEGVNRQCRLSGNLHLNGRSRSEIAKATGLQLSAVCGRVNNLIKFGLLNDDEKILCTVTKKWVHGVHVV